MFEALRSWFRSLFASFRRAPADEPAALPSPVPQVRLLPSNDIDRLIAHGEACIAKNLRKEGAISYSQAAAILESTGDHVRALALLEMCVILHPDLQGLKERYHRLGGLRDPWSPPSPSLEMKSVTAPQPRQPSIARQPVPTPAPKLSSIQAASGKGPASTPREKQHTPHPSQPVPRPPQPTPSGVMRNPAPVPGPNPAPIPPAKSNALARELAAATAPAADALMSPIGSLAEQSAVTSPEEHAQTEPIDDGGATISPEASTITREAIADETIAPTKPSTRGILPNELSSSGRPKFAIPNQSTAYTPGLPSSLIGSEHEEIANLEPTSTDEEGVSDGPLPGSEAPTEGIDSKQLAEMMKQLKSKKRPA